MSICEKYNKLSEKYNKLSEKINKQKQDVLFLAQAKANPNVEWLQQDAEKYKLWHKESSKKLDSIAFSISEHKRQCVTCSPHLACKSCGEKVMEIASICFKCSSQIEEDIEEMITATVDPQMVLDELNKPLVRTDGVFMRPLEWASTSGNLPLLDILLQDSRFSYPWRGVILDCIYNDQTDIVLRILQDPRTPKYCGNSCRHFDCHDIGQYLTQASLRGNQQIVDYLLQECDGDPKYIVNPITSGGRQPFGVLACSRCKKPTDTFLPFEKEPMCGECIDKSVDYCIYCHNRTCGGDDLCRLHKDAELIKWGSPTLKEGVTQCTLSNCDGAGVWSLSDESRLYYDLKCEPCLDSKKYCRACCGRKTKIHTCDKKLDLIDGFFYLR